MQDNILTLGNRVLDEEQCNAVIALAVRQAFTEDQDEIEGGTSRFKVDHSEIEVYNIVPDETGDADFEKIYSWVEEFLPDGECFEEPSHIQIICYPVDSYEFNTSQEEDTGLVLFNLSEGYHGGNLVVDSSIINDNVGDMLIVNNPSLRSVGVLPITAGEKWMLGVWFNENQNQDSDNYHHGDDDQPTEEKTDGPTFAKVVIK